MLGVPFWAWILGAIGVAILFAQRTVRAYRREVRAQFVAWLAETHPDWSVRVVDDFRLSVGLPGLGEVAIGLGRLYGTIARTRDRTAAARAHHYEAFSRPLADQILGPADAARLRPRLVTRAWLDAAPPEPPVIFRALGETGLHVVYVLDSPKSVTFITETQRALLGLDEAAIHERALANLAPTFDLAASLASLAQDGVVTVKTGDSFDAARLLLVPALLSGDDAVFACVPDRDTLLLARAPGPPLPSRPLLVTRRGIRQAP